MKKLLLKSMLLLCALVVGSMNGWADPVTATYSLTPNAASTGSSATSYVSTLTEFTYNEITWQMNQWNPSSLQIRTNQNSAGSEFRFYNSSRFPGRITQVVITFSALTVSDATKLMFKGGASAVTATSGGTAGTWNSTAKTLTWTPGNSDNFTYFAFYQDGRAASGNNYLASSDAIVVTYEVADKTDPTITFNNGSVKVGQTLDLSTLFDSNSTGTVTYSIFDGNSYASIEGSILTGLAVGSATVRASQAATAMFYNAKTAYATITVTSAKTLSSIAITTPPTKTYYGEGETFDPTGMVVRATYTDESTDNVTALCTYTPSTETPLTFDDDEVEVSYTESGITKTATQVIHVVDYASLPFSYDGGNSGMPRGLTQNGLGSDYGSSPKMKFDHVDDCVILKIAEAPGTLTFDVKGNGSGSDAWAGKFKVQSSIDGNSYIDVVTYTDLPSSKTTKTITTLAPNVRYIKWILTEKNIGNAALGNIALAAKEAETGDNTSITIDASGITNKDVFVSNIAGFLTTTVKNSSSVAIDGAKVQWVSSDKNVATIGSDGSVTLIGAGTTTITASYLGEAGVYNFSEETYDLTVTNTNPSAAGSVNNPYTVAQARDAIDADAGLTDVYVKGIVVSGGSLNDGKISYRISDNETSTNTLQIYLGKNLNNENFTNASDIAVGQKVVVYGTLQLYNSTTYQVATGNYLTSKMSSVATVDYNGWATYITTANVEFESENAFVVQAAGTDVVLTPVTQVPSGTPLVLKGEGKKYVTTLASAPAAVTNSLAISDGAGEGTTGDYVLGKKNGVAGFYKWKGSDLSAGKVYLPAGAVSTAREFLGFSFGDNNETTGVNELKVKMTDNQYFNLAGQRVAQPTKGLYIVNGKKVIMK